MGLDMYLKCNSRKVCQQVNDMTDEWERHQAKCGTVIQWRKSNQIHRWFVAFVQDGKDDCGFYPVSIIDLVNLHDTCRDVLESTKLVDAEIMDGKRLGPNGEWVPNMRKGQALEDPTEAKRLMPTADGFFFGSTEYDQWYWWDLEFTVMKLEKLMKGLKYDTWGNVYHEDEPDWEVQFYYTSSW